MNQYASLNQKVVLITGVASGIGKAQMEAFLAQGARVFGIDRQPLRIVPQSNLSYFQVDITQKEVLEEAVKLCETTFGTIDILVNTAGVLDAYKPLLETDETLWQTIYETNVLSYFRLTKAVLPQMIEKKAGVILNMASIAGLVAGGGGIAYTTFKHAIVGFTKQLALDYAAQGISVKAIAPGAIKTPMNAADFQGNGEMAQWVAKETPVQRWAEPEEVAALTLFLASSESSYLQGAVVPIDGGWTLK